MNWFRRRKKAARKESSEPMPMVSEKSVKKKSRGKAFEDGNEWRFPPGVSGNPGGRPRKLLDSYVVALSVVIDADLGLTVADLVARSVIELAVSGNMSAAVELRRATEGETINVPDFKQVIIDK